MLGFRKRKNNPGNLLKAEIAKSEAGINESSEKVENQIHKDDNRNISLFTPVKY